MKSCAADWGADTLVTRHVLKGCCVVVIFISMSQAQVSSFPYTERFDTVTVPALPQGWTTTINRLPGGDFATAASTPRSAPNCVLSTNSTIAQSLISPTFNLTNRTPDKLEFYTARSTTHTAGLLVEASTDNGSTFPIQLADTIRNPGTTSYVLSSIQLPASLVNQPTIKIRWGLVGGTGGTAGTFRIDDLTLTVLTSYDLSVVRLLVSPPQPTTKDSLVLSATVKNPGLQTASGYSVRFFRDTNNNRTLEPAEEFSSLSGNPIAVSDSSIFTVTHPSVVATDHRFYVSVLFAQDENAMNDTLSTLVSVGYAKGAMLINEIMYAPLGDEPEWVELFNQGPDTVNMKNWRISDNTVATKTLVTASDALIPPNSYVLIAKDPNISVIHPGITAPIFISTFAALNNATPDAVVIYDSRSISIDSLMYAPSWGGQNGKSLERIDSGLPTVNQSNWATSIDSVGSTPGRFNSIGKLQYDLTISQTFLSTTLINEQVVPTINVYAKNVGKSNSSLFTVSFYADSNMNGITDISERFAYLGYPVPILPGDSARVSYNWQNAPSGETSVIVVIDYVEDQRTTNNTAMIAVQIGYEPRTLIVNEFMYDPLTAHLGYIWGMVGNHRRVL